MNGKGENLRRGWTTGACATAAAKAAVQALLGGGFPDPVEITLPKGQTVAFALADHCLKPGAAMAAVVKDAGDDPDVTHGALIVVTARPAAAGAGILFRAGEGVGTVTLPGLPVPPGEPAINPMPRQMIAAAIAEVAGPEADFEIEIAVPGGAALAERTLNGRLGIINGLSILGTTGIVIPFSCAAWIDSIHRGIDVARATGQDHIAGSTGSTSERVVGAHHGLDPKQLIEMGDFIGGMLKYLRTHPVPRVTIAGGVAKMSKLAQGMLDVHSKRGRADQQALADIATSVGGDAALAAKITASNTVAEAFGHAAAAGIQLGDAVAARAWQAAARVLQDTGSTLEILVIDRDGKIRGVAPFRAVHGARPRNRR
jgi:cobalt-precorrin-5B (C1)-methyltransferase